MENKEDFLRPEQIAELDGHPIRLTSSYTDGKLLTINPDRKVTLKEDEEGYDQLWHLQPVEDGFLLTSSKDGNMVCHYMEDGGMARIRPLSMGDSNCVWKLGSSGEIYQKNPKGGERYLWMANDQLYVTLDGYLAESWIPLSDVKMDIIIPPPEKTTYTTYIILVLIFLICLFMYVYKN